MKNIARAVRCTKVELQMFYYLLPKFYLCCKQPKAFVEFIALSNSRLSYVFDLVYFECLFVLIFFRAVRRLR